MPAELSMVTGVPVRMIIAPGAEAFTRRVGIEQLAESIKAVGLINPLTVKSAGKQKYQIIAGRRRYWACIEAGIESINCNILDEEDFAHADVIEVTENLHRVQLTPMQEAEAIAKLRSLGHDDESIAADLGMTRQFVARRAKLLDLSKDWKKALSGATDLSRYRISAVHLWPVACLEMIARYPEKRQDDLFAQFGSDPEMTVEDLKANLSREEVKLGSAIWDLADATLCAAAGACTVCPKRAGAQPLLFSDEADGVIDAKKDTCLDQSCFKLKHKAAIERKVKEKLREHPDLVKITEGGARGHTLGSYQYDKAKKEDKGAVPALMVDGPKAGSMTYVKVKKQAASRTASSSGSKEKVRTPAELAKERDDRRWEIVGDEIARAIGGPRFSPQKKQPYICRAPGGLLSESEKEITRLKTALALATMVQDRGLAKTLAGLSQFVSSAHATPTSALVQMFWKENRWGIAEAFGDLTLSVEKGPLQILLGPFLDIANLKFDDLWQLALKKVAEPKAEIAPTPKVQKPKAGTPTQKTPIKPKSKTRPDFMAPLQPSPELAAIIGDKPLIHSEATKRLWDYIKKNGLQDQANRRMINPDEKLSPIFGGKESISMFDMTKLRAKHLKPAGKSMDESKLASKKKSATSSGNGTRPACAPNAHGVFGDCERVSILMPKTLRTKAAILLAKDAAGKWHSSHEYEGPSGGGGWLPSERESFESRDKAIGNAVKWLLAHIKSSEECSGMGEATKKLIRRSFDEVKTWATLHGGATA